MYMMLFQLILGNATEKETRLAEAYVLYVNKGTNPSSHKLTL